MPLPWVRDVEAGDASETQPAAQAVDGAPNAGAASNASGTWFGRRMPWAQMNEEDPPQEEDQLFADLTWQTRIQGFALFAALGFVSNALSWIALGTGMYTKYAVLATMGNLMSVCSTMMLMGPKRQCERMFDPVRREASIVFIASMFLTIFVAMVLKSTVLVALCSTVQYLALIWYSLSYVPYGREMAMSCVRGCGRMIMAV